MKHKWYTGAGDASYENVPLVDANGRRLPYPTQGWADGGCMKLPPEEEEKIREGVLSGKYELPFYGDFPAMADVERRATWNLMLTEESTTKVLVKTMKDGGFDISRDQLQSYKLLEGKSPAQWRLIRSGGILTDWDLKTTVDGLYAAGSQLFSPEDHSFCAATGRYAGRKAAAYVKGLSGDLRVSREQIDKEKERVLAPTKRTSGIEWKELHSGLTRVMQYFASEYRTERLMKMGLEEIARIEENAVPQLYALDPHKLMRSLEDISMIEFAKIHLRASLERKASSAPMELNRIDYPENDPEEWKKYITIKQENGQVQFGELPLHFWGNMRQQYEEHNKDYTGVYTPNK